jgi:hypothetical protein
VTGDLLRLTNGSKINVVNGPLILVTGSAPTGSTPSVSTLNVSGALVNFGPIGGNQIVVNNSICVSACTVTSGIQVSGSDITIGPAPIKNPSLGTISVSGTNTAVIQTTSGGKVNITAP